MQFSSGLIIRSIAMAALQILVIF